MLIHLHCRRRTSVLQKTPRSVIYFSSALRKTVQTTFTEKTLQIKKRTKTSTQVAACKVATPFTLVSLSYSVRRAKERGKKLHRCHRAANSRRHRRFDHRYYQETGFGSMKALVSWGTRTSPRTQAPSPPRLPKAKGEDHQRRRTYERVPSPLTRDLRAATPWTPPHQVELTNDPELLYSLIGPPSASEQMSPARGKGLSIFIPPGCATLALPPPRRDRS